jgi:hypothetical protein
MDRCYHDPIKGRRLDSSFGKTCSSMLSYSRGFVDFLGGRNEG